MAKDIVQFSIDVFETSEEKIIDALVRAGIIVVGIGWKARWTSEDYFEGKPPVSSD